MYQMSSLINISTEFVDGQNGQLNGIFTQESFLSLTLQTDKLHTNKTLSPSLIM